MVASAFAEVVAKLAVVQPSMNDERLMAAYHQTVEAGVLQHIRSTLYLDAVMAAYAVVADRTKGAESMARLRRLLDDGELMADVRAMHLTYTVPISLNEPGEEKIDAAFRERLMCEDRERSEQNFKMLCERAPRLWMEFSRSEIFFRIKDSRDGVLAHRGKTEGVAGPQYNRLEDYGLTWSDCEQYLAMAEPVMNDYASLFCETDFNFDSTRETFGASAKKFWLTCQGPVRRTEKTFP